MEPDDRILYEKMKQFVSMQMQKEEKKLESEKKEPMIVFIVVATILSAALLWVIVFYLCDKKRKEKMKRVGPITFKPTIFLKEKKLSLYEGGPDDKNKTPEAKIKTTYSFCGFYNMNAHNLISILQMVFNITDEELIPYNTKSISIKMDGFRHGEACHKFEPINGAAPGSYFTYQVYGEEAIQVTRYVENGVSKMAGLCIYVWDRFGDGDEVSIDVIRKLMNLGDKLPSKEKEKEKSRDVPKSLIRTAKGKVPIAANSTNLQIKFCSRLGRIFITEEKNGVVCHQEWNGNSQSMIEESCATCTNKQENEQPPTYASLA